MSTVLADWHLGVMVADSNVSDGERCGRMRKVWRIRHALIGCAGTVAEIEAFVEWYRAGMEGRSRFPSVSALVLSREGLLHFAGSDMPIHVQSGREAVGSGAMAALAAYEAMGWTDPRRAVAIVCKHDAGSRGPVRVYRV
jgi:ATP-dependent protease HslVU (ClpYQ) peptidase subunit